MSRAFNKLTDSTIRAATAEGQAQRKLADGGGLTMIVRPNAKVWWLRYRFAGKEKTYSLGAYPEISLRRARIDRDEARQLLSRGIDPVKHRQSLTSQRVEAAANTFETLARDWLRFQEGELAEGTLRLTRRRLENWIFPYLGHLPVQEIEPPAVLQTLRRIAAKGKHETAQRLRQRISQIYRFGIGEGRAVRDPATDLRGLLRPAPTKSRAAVINPTEVGALLRAMRGYSGQPATCAALELAPLLFLRPGELRKAEWSEINLSAALWIVPGERMKGTRKAKRAGRVPDHLIPLSRQALAILEPLNRLTGQRPFVFESTKPGRPLSENTINAALRAVGYDGDVMVGHGFRATASTLLHELGWPPEVIELQLAHRQRNQVAAAYNRAARLGERKEMMQAWADYLENLRGETKQ